MVHLESIWTHHPPYDSYHLQSPAVLKPHPVRLIISDNFVSKQVLTSSSRGISDACVNKDKRAVNTTTHPHSWFTSYFWKHGMPQAPVHWHHCFDIPEYKCNEKENDTFPSISALFHNDADSLNRNTNMATLVHLRHRGRSMNFHHICQISSKSQAWFNCSSSFFLTFLACEAKMNCRSGFRGETHAQKWGSRDCTKLSFPFSTRHKLRTQTSR